MFSELSLDTNPIHLDEAYAKTTRFGRPIAHGLLVASMFSGLLGTKYGPDSLRRCLAQPLLTTCPRLRRTLRARVPGQGAVYVSQTLQFTAPTFVGETITARVEVTKTDPARRLVTLATTCRKADGTTVIRGEAVALMPRPPKAPADGGRNAAST